MRLLTALSLFFVLAVPAAAQGNDSKPIPEEHKLAISRHSIDIVGGKLDYTATAGLMPLLTDDKQIRARVFFVAYTRDNVTDVSARPVTFVFNGGPGSSSVWLHLGAVGPKRVVMTDEGKPLPPPGRLVDNTDTWLGASDLVFIDPVGTGYSRPAKGHEQSEFSGLRQDTESVGEFIRMYTTRFLRWSSPKFLCGESYGTTRAASLASFLQDKYRMYLNGVILISSVLNFQTIRFNVGNDLPYVLFLPTYTATAAYHKKLAPELTKDLPATLAEVQKFALEQYIVALAKGASLPAEERKDVVAKLSRYTGLTPEYIDQTDLRIGMSRFTKELLRAEQRTVGRLDSRFKGIDRDSAGERFEFDPSMAAIDGPYGSTINDYLRRELGYVSDAQYEVLGGRVQPWSYADFENRYVEVQSSLREAMTKNKNLKVFVASGHYDLATPYFATDYTFNQIGLAPSLRKNVRIEYYEAGHMMYIDTPSRVKLTDDIKKFYADATKKAEAGELGKADGK